MLGVRLRRPVRPRRTLGCLPRLALVLAGLIVLGLIADQVEQRWLGGSPPGQPRLGSRDPRLGLPTAADLPAGYQVVAGSTGLIVNARKASEDPAPELLLDQLTRWGRLSGYRVTFARYASPDEPKSQISAETSIFWERSGAGAFFDYQVARIPAEAVRFYPLVGDQAVGWRPGQGAAFGAVRLLFRKEATLVEIAMSGPANIANPDTSLALAQSIADRLPGG